MLFLLILLLLFTVRATMCVYSDSLDWVIDLTPQITLKYI